MINFQTSKKELRPCNCRGNMNANNPKLLCSSCGGVNPMLFKDAFEQKRQRALEEVDTLFRDTGGSLTFTVSQVRALIKTLFLK